MGGWGRYSRNSLVMSGMLDASADFRLFFGIYYDQNDSNIYIQYHIWIFYEIVRPSQVGIHERSEIYEI